MAARLVLLCGSLAGLVEAWPQRPEAPGCLQEHAACGRRLSLRSAASCCEGLSCQPVLGAQEFRCLASSSSPPRALAEGREGSGAGTAAEPSDLAGSTEGQEGLPREPAELEPRVEGDRSVNSLHAFDEPWDGTNSSDEGDDSDDGDESDEDVPLGVAPPADDEDEEDLGSNATADDSDADVPLGIAPPADDEDEEDLGSNATADGADDADDSDADAPSGSAGGLPQASPMPLPQCVFEGGTCSMGSFTAECCGEHVRCISVLGGLRKRCRRVEPDCQGLDTFCGVHGHIRRECCGGSSCQQLPGGSFLGRLGLMTCRP